MRNRLFNDSYFKKSISRPYRTQICDTKLRRLVLYSTEPTIYKKYFGIGSGTNLRTWLFCAFRSDHHSITDMTSQRLAEDEWFEHSVAYFIHDGFQDRSIKPLWQSSLKKIVEDVGFEPTMENISSHNGFTWPFQ